MSNKRVRVQYSRLGRCFIALALLGGLFGYVSLSEAVYAMPADRTIDWSYSGIPGGIPNNRTTICATANAATYGNGTTEARTYLQGLITACGQDQVVYLPAGTYKVTGILTIPRPMVIRGAGPTQTIIKFYGSAGSRGHLHFNYFTPPTVTQQNWTAGYTKGSTQVTLAAVTGLSVGQEIWLDQLNDTSIVNPTGNEGAASTHGRTGTDLSSGNTRAQLQINRVSAINGNVVTLETPLYWTAQSGLTPQAVYWKANGGSGSPKYNGVENLKIDGINVATDSADSLVTFDVASYSWVKNVEIANIPSRGVRFAYGYRNEIRQSYIHDAQAVGSQAYGIELDYNSATLIEDNVFAGLVVSVMMGFPNSGCVIGYNYMTNPGPGSNWSYADISAHDAHNFMNLYEGNIGTMIGWDVIWGSGSHQVAFRNRFTGLYTGKSNYTFPVSVQAWNRYDSIVGNVLGTTGYHDRYEVSTPGSGSVTAIYYLGHWSTDGADMTNYDATTVSSLLRHGNWDSVNKGVVWNGSDDHNLPNSLYLTNKPNWWGNLRWPPITPDVSMKVTDNPAKLRYDGSIQKSPDSPFTQ